jgi:hypothetical protein
MLTSAIGRGKIAAEAATPGATTMSANFDALANQILSLPTEQRVELAHMLWVSVEGEVNDTEVFEEIARREAELKGGTVQPIDFDTAMREIRQSLT